MCFSDVIQYLNFGYFNTENFARHQFFFFSRFNVNTYPLTQKILQRVHCKFRDAGPYVTRVPQSRPPSLIRLFKREIGFSTNSFFFWRYNPHRGLYFTAL